MLNQIAREQNLDTNFINIDETTKQDKEVDNNINVNNNMDDNENDIKKRKSLFAGTLPGNKNNLDCIFPRVSTACRTK